jgi:hypothetical protein
MSNDNPFYHEFTRVISREEFISWMNNMLIPFNKNMEDLKEEPKELRQWVAMFLAWSEYEYCKED